MTQWALGPPAASLPRHLRPILGWRQPGRQFQSLPPLAAGEFYCCRTSRRSIAVLSSFGAGAALGLAHRGGSRSTAAAAAGAGIDLEADSQYPGTAVERMRNIHRRVKSLTIQDLSGDWEDVRRKILWAGGLRDLTDVPPGQGYTGHAFNDDNHCDLCAMLGDVSDNLNTGKIQGIALGNRLGPGIRVASLPELGPGGSWSTCTNGCNLDPPMDVAHVQFRARIAFKLVWCPPDYGTFVLVDDDGVLLASGTPNGCLPPELQRVQNYMLVANSKYARAADAIHGQRAAE